MVPLDPATEDMLVPLSALQHYLFCPRQCGLIHVECVWAENDATADGRLMHERVDEGQSDRRGGIHTVRSIVLRSRALGVTGKADVVEFRGQGADARPYPVEYKRGHPKAHRADEVQLCAQAICLEEMFGVTIPEGALFYGETRHRTIVTFDTTLRDLTATVAQATHAMITSGQTPPPHYSPVCKQCSLVDLCAPRWLEHPPHIERWLSGQLESVLAEN